MARLIPRHWRLIIAVLVLLVVMGTIVVGAFVLPIADWLDATRAFLTRVGPAGAVLFFLIFVAATATVVPAAPFSLMAGLMFGALGFPLAVAAATSGAALAFLASRYVLRARMSRAVARAKLFAALDRAVGAQSWRIVGLTRMSPLIPFNVQSLVFGATRIGFRPYVVATALGIVPNTGFLVYLGSIGRTSISGAGPARWILTVAGVLATLLAMILVTRAARREFSAIVTE